MRSEKKMLAAFLLNLSFAVLEWIGGAVTGSVAILSDAIHDLGDAAGIGIACGLERRSRRPPDRAGTFGYARYSVVGGLITSGLLLAGSAAVILRAAERLIRPAPVHETGMMLLAGLGLGVNLGAALFTRGGESLNQRAVHLHMLEDVLGWAAVLVGAVVIKWTGAVRIDPLLSVAVAGLLFVQALRSGKEGLDILLEKAPRGLDPEELRAGLEEVDGVREIHHFHLWSLDGRQHCATLHAVTKGDPRAVKEALRAALRERGVGHVTVELEGPGEDCPAPVCRPEAAGHPHHHHHHPF